MSDQLIMPPEEQLSNIPIPDPMLEAMQGEFSRGIIPSELASLNLTPSSNSYLLEQPLSKQEIFRCTNLTKSYGSGAAYIEVIKGISFTVQQGEYIVILGPSGSGKSTLLHLLAGLETPNRGQIRMRNQVIQDFTDDDLSLYHREQIGLLFQSFNLLSSLLVWENVAFPLMLAGAPVDWRQHEALKMLDRFGMAEFAMRYPNQLSGGQQQRIALARALIHDPDLLLVDEPTGNLDSKSADLVIHELNRLHKEENRTIILVTHSQVFLPFATRVFYINDGQLLTSNESYRIDQTNGPDSSRLELNQAQPAPL